ncbi:TetR family transcriptional regulator [Nonomuraea sp. NPDC050022]|uniref:TetR family transcriptional regulator n=1 Tax=unclassified Nonomuraea TaxID=2593643 RepID=UPI0033ED68C2
MEPVRRPGGRSARVRTAVHEAVLDLLRKEDWDSLSLARVAERSGVHQATLYRRWGTLGALISTTW